MVMNGKVLFMYMNEEEIHAETQRKITVIPGVARAAKRRARRPGTHFITCQISQWVPDRARVPDFDIEVGASGMTSWDSRGGAERFDARIAMHQPVSHRSARAFTLIPYFAVTTMLRHG